MLEPLAKKYKSISGKPNALGIYATNDYEKIAVAEKNNTMMIDTGKGMVCGGCLRLEASGLRCMLICSCAGDYEQYATLHPEVYDNDFGITADEMRNVRLALGLYFMGNEPDGRLAERIKDPNNITLYNAYKDAIAEKLNSCLDDEDRKIMQYYYEFGLAEDELLALRDELDLDTLSESSWLTRELLEYKIFKILYRGTQTVNDVLGRQ